MQIFVEAPSGGRNHIPWLEVKNFQPLNYRCINTPGEIWTHTLLVLSQAHIPVLVRGYKWGGVDSNHRRPKSSDLQSDAIAAMRPPLNMSHGTRTHT